MKYSMREKDGRHVMYRYEEEQRSVVNNAELEFWQEIERLREENKQLKEQIELRGLKENKPETTVVDLHIVGTLEAVGQVKLFSKEIVDGLISSYKEGSRYELTASFLHYVIGPPKLYGLCIEPWKAEPEKEELTSSPKEEEKGKEEFNPYLLPPGDYVYVPKEDYDAMRRKVNSPEYTDDQYRKAMQEVRDKLTAHLVELLPDEFRKESGLPRSIRSLVADYEQYKESRKESLTRIEILERKLEKYVHKSAAYDTIVNLATEIMMDVQTKRIKTVHQADTIQ